MTKEVLPPPADWSPVERSTSRMIPNPDHPLNRKSTYNPKEPQNLVREANRRLQNEILCEEMERAWGPDWDKI